MIRRYDCRNRTKFSIQLSQLQKNEVKPLRKRLKNKEEEERETKENSPLIRGEDANYANSRVALH